MCSSCRGSCGGCFDICRCRGCCGRNTEGQCRKHMEKLRGIDKYHWFEQCTTVGCPECPGEGDDNGFECECIDRRNRHIIEALSCLFKCSIQYIVSTLFKLAYHQYHRPLCRFPRDRVWDVMKHVKAPYTELHDLEIYDSMYDRCGLPIDPLHFHNIYKILRLMFLSSVLTLDQQEYLLQMLQRLNAHAHCPVHVEMLLQTIGSINLKKLVCSIQDQEALTRRLYTSRQCDEICSLYNHVGAIDKKVIKRHRTKRHDQFNKRTKPAEHIEDAAVRQSILNRQFCTRQPIDPADAISTPSSVSRRSTSQGSKSMRHSSTVRYSKGVLTRSF